MNQTRIVFSLVISLVVAPFGGSADELIQREGRFIHLTTDLSSAEEVDSLVSSFDTAVPQWAEFWNLPLKTLETWKVDAYVIRNKAEFQRQGLIPPTVPDFPFGYALGNQIWVLAQPSEYYTRHLLLHEGTHSLAFEHFGGAGPTWFREGTAELLSTHGGSATNLRINQVPADRDDVPYWGRFKLMKQLRAKEAIPSLETVMRYAADLRGDVETYGWSWAAAMILHAYPEYRNAFFAAADNGRDEGPGFNRDLKRQLQPQWPVLAARWRLMCHDLDYGFDWTREQVALSVTDQKWNGKPLKMEVAADQGWQSIGVRVPGGVRLRLSPSGRITLADAPKPWDSEPAGITYQYHRGRPLGQLLVTVIENASEAGATTIAPVEIQALDQEKSIEIAKFSWLLFRVNDGLGDLGDNRGTYSVTVSLDR